MPKMVGIHAVVDIDRWIAGKAERAGAIGQVAGQTKGANDV